MSDVSLLGEFLTFVQSKGKGGEWDEEQLSEALDIAEKQAKDEGGVNATPGRMMIALDKWEQVWHDKDADGNVYDHFGIIVGPPAQPTAPNEEKEEEPTTTEPDIDALAKEFLADLLGGWEHGTDEEKKDFSEGDHPRANDGKFGAGGNASGSSQDATTASSASGKAQKLVQLATKLPKAIYAKAKAKAEATFKKFEARYGRKQAIAIMAAAVVGLAIPLPGTQLLMMAPAIGAAELYRHFTGGPDAGKKPAAPDATKDEGGILRSRLPKKATRRAQTG